jgi:hypothetical protein
MLYVTSRAGILFAALLLAGPIAAQEQVFRTLNVSEGARVRLGIHGNVSKACEPGALPEIKIVTAPKNGTLAVSSGKTKAGALSRCPALEVPARAVFYQSNPRYTGADEVVYQLVRPNRPSQAITIKITVGGSAKPPAKRSEDSVDL